MRQEPGALLAARPPFPGASLWGAAAWTLAVPGVHRPLDLARTLGGGSSPPLRRSGGAQWSGTMPTSVVRPQPWTHCCPWTGPPCLGTPRDSREPGSLPYGRAGSLGPPHGLLHEPVGVHRREGGQHGAGGHALLQADELVVRGEVGGLVDVHDRDGHPRRGLDRHLDAAGQGRLVGHHHGQHEGSVQLVVDRLQRDAQEVSWPRGPGARGEAGAPGAGPEGGQLRLPSLASCWLWPVGGERVWGKDRRPRPPVSHRVAAAGLLGGTASTRRHPRTPAVTRRRGCRAPSLGTQGPGPRSRAEWVAWWPHGCATVGRPLGKRGLCSGHEAKGLDGKPS